MKRVAVAVLLLALLGVAACGHDEPAPAPEVPAAEIPSWPPPLPADALAMQREEFAALLAEAAERGLSVSRAECDADWWVKEGTLRLMEGPDYDLDEHLRGLGCTREDLARSLWIDLLLDKIREQEGMTANDASQARFQRWKLTTRIVEKRRK